MKTYSTQHTIRESRFTENTIPLPRGLQASAIAQSRAYQRKKGSGESIPQLLVLTRISATGKPSQCTGQKFITIECCHGAEQCIPIRCGKCEGCRNHWRRKVRAMVGDGCKGARTWFVTMTFKEYPHQMEENRYDFAQKRFHAFLRLAAKRGITFQYLRVVELQKRGTPHFHLVVNRLSSNGHRISDTGMARGLLFPIALKVGFGKMFDIQAVKHGGAGAASYLSKYLTKNEVFNMKRDDGRAIRRYCRSRRWCHNAKRTEWRFRRVGAILDTPEYHKEPTCECYQRLTMRASLQAWRWVERALREDTWCAPMGLFDHILAQTEN